MVIIGIDRKWLCCILRGNMRWVEVKNDDYNTRNISDLEVVAYYRGINSNQVHKCLYEYNDRILIDCNGEYRIFHAKDFTKDNTYNNINILDTI